MATGNGGIDLRDRSARFARMVAERIPDELLPQDDGALIALAEKVARQVAARV